MLEKLILKCYNIPRRKNKHVHGLFHPISCGHARPIEINQPYLWYGCYFFYSGRKGIYRRADRRVQKDRQSYSRSERGPKETALEISIPKIVIDSCVYFTAADSPHGNSGKLIRLARKKGIKLYISDHILNETIRNLRAKSTLRACERHSRNLSYLHPEKNPPRESLIKAYEPFIGKEDAPVLALATYTQADFLITLNTKDFINNPKLELLDLPFRCITPGNFIVLMGEELVRS